MSGVDNLEATDTLRMVFPKVKQFDLWRHLEYKTQRNP